MRNRACLCSSFTDRMLQQLKDICTLAFSRNRDQLQADGAEDAACRLLIASSVGQVALHRDSR